MEPEDITFFPAFARGVIDGMRQATRQKMKVAEQVDDIIRDVGSYEIVVSEKRSHWLSLKVYHVIGKTESGAKVYNRDGYQSSPDPVEDRSTAQVMISGSIKWDGCSDLTIEDEPLHFCGRSNMEEFAALLSAIYDLAAELIPSYEGG